MTRRARSLVRSLGGVLILVIVVGWVGTGPFLDGFRVIDVESVLAALCIGLAATVCCAWRWRRVAADLGVDLPWREAVAAYYRSQFLNATLPSGVVGDVHRAVRHGRDIGDLGRGVRAVVLERIAGLAAQVAIAVIVLLVLPSPVRPSQPAVTVLAAGVVAAVFVVGYVVARGTWLVAFVASGIALAGHTCVFVIAARAAGSTAPLALLFALTLLALMSMTLPLSFAGWGPREGVAAWGFAAAGLGATQGVTTAVAYGALALFACLPGLLVLAVSWLTTVSDRTVAASGVVPAFDRGASHE